MYENRTAPSQTSPFGGKENLSTSTVIVYIDTEKKKTGEKEEEIARIGVRHGHTNPACVQEETESEAETPTKYKLGNLFLQPQEKAHGRETRHRNWKRNKAQENSKTKALL